MVTMTVASDMALTRVCAPVVGCHQEIAFKLRFNDRQVLLSASTKNLMAKWMLVRPIPPPSSPSLCLPPAGVGKTMPVT